MAPECGRYRRGTDSRGFAIRGAGCAGRLTGAADRGDPGDTQARRIWHKPHHIAAEGGPAGSIIQTGEIREDPSGQKTAPFSSIIYDLDGDAWVYKVSAPLTYVREGVVIERIKGDHAYLKEGPPAGTQVVTVGVPELYGTEVGVNGE